MKQVLSIECINTGGGCLVDMIRLANGAILAVSDEFFGLFKNEDDFWEGECLLGDYFENLGEE